MKKKKLDNRIIYLIENCVKTNERSIFVVCGPKAVDRVVSLYYIFQKVSNKNTPSLLWCYNRNLGFKSDKSARLKELTKKIGRESALEDPFHLFLSVTNINFCYFKDTKRVLGTTFDMLVISEFAGITPNVMARTMETVAGGGAIVILLNEIESLKQLYTMSMDIHMRFRKSFKKMRNFSESTFVPRFNERFLLSLVKCSNCLVVSDELSIIPISKRFENITPNRDKIIPNGQSHDEKKLSELRIKVQDLNPINRIVEICKTFDQADALLTLAESLNAKTLQSTIALIAARGRGKSAALGLSISLAVVYGYSNIFVSSPSSENVKTLFEFIIMGLNALEYTNKDHFELVKSNVKSGRDKNTQNIIRINIYKNHRQTIQYIHPNDHHLTKSAELLIIDEAAAIPLPIVKKLFGPYVIFISSTINGYEGTGRSLSLKLLNSLKEKRDLGKSNVTGRDYKELKMTVPIRYAMGDAIESWLNQLLCLNATSAVPIATKCPHPDDCTLYYVNRDALFAFHDETEEFLHNMVSLFVSSHYKNSPDDLQLMSDSPEHHLFVLLGPISPNDRQLPSIYCAIQVAFEGAINRKIVNEYLSKGKTGVGDLIPWTISRYFQESEFSELSGARIVRIATHPEYQSMGYGSKAMTELLKYYKGEIYSLSENDPDNDDEEEEDEEEGDNDVVMEEKRDGMTIAPRDKNSLPPLLESLEERKAEEIDYVGVSFGITTQLYKFWLKFKFAPVYVRLSQNEITGEHSSIMIRELHGDKFTTVFNEDFKKRFVNLLAFEFSKFSIELTLNVLRFSEQDRKFETLDPKEFGVCYSQFDLKRLNYYSKNYSDYRIILDLIPMTCKLYFLRKIPVQLNTMDAAVLVGVGFQKKSFIEVAKEFNMQIGQIISIFNNIMLRIISFLNEVYQSGLENEEETKLIGKKRKVGEIDPDYPDSKKVKRDE